MRKLTDVFPARYLKSYELGMAAGMLWVLGEAFRAQVLDWLKQLQVDTATAQGLTLFEVQFGITPMAADTLDDRRGRIKAKMRGAQTVTAAWMEAIADSYVDGQSTATEIPREHRVDIEFNGEYGVPANIDSLTAALLESMPSHVLFGYQYRYLLVREVREMTVAELQTQGIYKFAFARRDGI